VAGLRFELLDAKGRPWPAKTRLKPGAEGSSARLEPLEALRPGSIYRLVASVDAAGGGRLTWSEPLVLTRPPNQDAGTP
jgi:hypothetical protein